MRARMVVRRGTLVGAGVQVVIISRGTVSRGVGAGICRCTRFLGAPKRGVGRMTEVLHFASVIHVAEFGKRVDFGSYMRGPEQLVLPPPVQAHTRPPNRIF